MKETNKNFFEINLTFSLILLILIMIQAIFGLVEKNAGLISGEATSSVNVTVAVLPAISINSPGYVDMLLPLDAGGRAKGSFTWNIKTNNRYGWKMDVKASTQPALKNEESYFADYTEAVEGVPETWSLKDTDSEFGFSASGHYVDAKFNDEKYIGFKGANPIQVAYRDAYSDGTGDNTTIHFQAEVGSNHNQPYGIYQATITATVTML